MMDDREKVILGIENCITTDSVTECRKTERPFILLQRRCGCRRTRTSIITGLTEEAKWDE